MNDDFSLIWNMLSKSFDITVLREKHILKKMIEDGQCEYLLERDARKQVLGGLLWCDLQDFLFLEYLVVVPEMRNRGIGHRILSNFLAERKRPTILEVESPHSQDDINRIEFYKKLDFHVNCYPYTTPPFQAGCPKPDLMLMSYPFRLGEKEFKKIKEAISVSLYEPYMA